MKRKIANLSRNENGVTLVEVLASLVIVSIILLGVFSLLTFTNKTAVSNNAKLVSINLSKATIERMKVKPEDYVDIEDLKNISEEFTITYDRENCAPENCQDLYTLTVNDQEYDVEIKVSQSTEEKALQLINVVVTVSLPERNINSTVEGYVNYANYE